MVSPMNTAFASVSMVGVELMFAFLAMIPGLAAVVEGISKAFFDAKVRLVQARIGGDRDVAVALVSAAAAQENANASKLAIIASNKILTFMLIAFATPLLVFEWKVIVYDIVYMDGTASTDPIKGQVAEWANTIIGFLFGSATVMGLGKMWFSRDKTGQ